MSKGNAVQKPFWIIKNVKRNSIWKQPYLSKFEAEEELKTQLALHPTATGWFIEMCSYWGEKDGMEDFQDDITRSALNNF